MCCSYLPFSGSTLRTFASDLKGYGGTKSSLHFDPAKPQVLIYEPVGNKLVLAGAEWFVPVQVAGGVAPTIFGQTLAGPMDGHEPIMPASLRHYDLHVWLWKDNPRGVFTSTNAALKCAPGAPYTVAIGADHHH